MSKAKERRTVFQPDIKTWPAEPTKLQTARQIAFIRKINPIDDVMDAFDHAEYLLELARQAGEPDPHLAAAKYWSGEIPMPVIEMKSVPEAKHEVSRPLRGLAETNSVTDESEPDAIEELTVVPVEPGPVAGADTDMEDEDDVTEAACDAALSEEADDACGEEVGEGESE